MGSMKTRWKRPESKWPFSYRPYIPYCTKSLPSPQLNSGDKFATESLRLLRKSRNSIFFLFTLCPLYSIENVDKRNFPVHVCWGYSLYPSSLAHDRPYNSAYFAFYLILLSNQRPFRIESSHRPIQLYSILHSL